MGRADVSPLPAAERAVVSAESRGNMWLTLPEPTCTK